ncbi:MAG: T9SS type A sorting domain-containing protein [Flavobacteriales bacterium]|nr:T9SS type A sorting domain-containing protein [Flavobacteriales bacterium]
MYTSSGTYIDILTATNGCDSTVTTNLNVLSASYPVIFGGIPDSASAPGGYFAFDRRLVFDCYSPSTIASALIYSEDFGIVTFELSDDNGTIIESSTQSVVPGPQRITLDFNMEVGTDYELGVDNPNQIGLFRSNTNVNYPYNFGSLASLTGSTANNTGFYYFFYDIELVGQATSNVLSICKGDSIIVGLNTYYDTGIYLDTLDASNFCDSVIYTDLTVNQPNQVSLTTDPVNGKLCLGDIVTITASAGFQAYLWDNGMNGQVISDNPIIDQLYTVTAVDDNNCRSEKSVMIYVDSCTTGITSDIYSSLSIYPNPSNGIVNINLDINNISDIEINVYNALGEEVYIIKADKFIGEYSNRIDLSSKSKGVYLLKIKTSNSLFNRKLVIE